MAEFKCRISVFENSIWGLHFEVPDHIASLFIKGNYRRVVCTINNQKKVHAAIMPNKGLWYILLSKALCRELRVKEGDEITVLLESETSEYGMPMPEELEICLWQEEGAMKYFEALTPGKQRSLIYIVSKLKSPDSRIRKGLAISEHLSECKGQLDYRKLNEKIKEINRRIL